MDLKNSRMTVCALDSFDSVQAAEAGTCEHGNEPSGFVKRGEYSDSLNTWNIILYSVRQHNHFII